MKLLNLGYKEALQIIKKYSSGSNILSPQPQLKIRRKAFKFPSNTVPLLPSHKQYLEGRGFDPDLIERLWDVQSTGPISHLDKTDYRHRLIIPYFWDNSIVSFQSRDVTDKHMARYMACPSDRELIPHKSILYGKQSEWGDTGICVEGPTDVWRFGVKSFAVSGIKYTSIQVREIAKRFKQIIIIFDPEVQAIIQAYKLSKSLNMRNVETIMIKLDKADPGEMSQKEANYLVKQLIE
jgi:DNA primase